LKKDTRRVNLVYILSNLGKAVAFEWITENLDCSKYNITFILLNPGESSLELYLKKNNIEVYRILYRGKKDVLHAFISIYKILKKEKAAIIHAHLFEASLIGLCAGKLLGVPMRIYTRHHATLHHMYFPRAVYYDRLINAMATDIVAISNNVQTILTSLEGVRPDKIHLIHHGFKLEDFQEIPTQRILALKKKYQLEGAYPIVGVISRYIEWKGIQYIITAFKKLSSTYPNACLVLANANGPFKEEIGKILKDLPQDKYREILFEEDVFALYQLFNVFIHTPIDEHAEAFGQTYVEALAAGIPSIFTLSGVANEFIRDGENALVVPFKNDIAIYDALVSLLTQEEQIRAKLIKEGREDVNRYFSLESMIAALDKLYKKNESNY